MADFPIGADSVRSIPLSRRALIRNATVAGAIALVPAVAGAAVCVHSGQDEYLPTRIFRPLAVETEARFDVAWHKAVIAGRVCALAASISHAARKYECRSRAAQVRAQHVTALEGWRAAVDQLAEIPARTPEQLQRKVDAIGRGLLRMGVDARVRGWRTAVERDAEQLGVLCPLKPSKEARHG